MTRYKEIEFDKKDFDDKTEAKIYAGKYKLKSWGYGGKNQVNSKSSKINLETKLPEIDVGLMMMETVAVCLAEAPFKTSPKSPNYEAIFNMPPFIGDELFAITTELNDRMTPEIKKKSDK